MGWPAQDAVREPTAARRGVRSSPTETKLGPLDWARWLVLLAGGVVAVLLAARLHAFFLASPGPIGFDDGYTLSMGARLSLRSFLPYVDGCSHRGPLLYWAAAVAQASTGTYGWLGGRILSAVAALCTVVALLGAGVAARRPLAGVIGALFYVWSVLGVSPIHGMFAITGEAVASPFLVGAVLSAAWASHRARSARARSLSFAASGACVALGALAKQTNLPLLGPIVLWALSSAATRTPFPVREGVHRSVAALVGFLAMFAAALLPYAIAGELSTFWYWYVEYNRDIYMAPFTVLPDGAALRAFSNEYRWFIGALAVTTTWALARTAWSSRKRGFLGSYRAAGLEVTSALFALLTFAAGVAAQRYWPHYFVCVFPFAGLVLGVQAETVLRFTRQKGARLAGLSILMAASSAVVAYTCELRRSTLVAQRRMGGWITPPRTSEVCRLIDSYSQPTDSLFIWGFEGDVYLTCRRRPATRFTYLTLVAGIVPPRWLELREDRVARGARENLIEDLLKERPSVILDKPYWLGGVSLTRIPVVHQLVSAHYCHRGAAPGENASIWVRNDLPGCASAGR